VVGLVASRYQPAEAPAWDGLVASAANATFMHARGYVDYHQMRFVDHSVALANAAGEQVAVFPANEVGEEIWSHQGLSYGGLVGRPGLSPTDWGDCFRQLFFYYQKLGFKKIFYKALPPFYWAQADGPATEASLLAQWGAEVVRRDLNTVVDLAQPLRFQTRRRRQIGRAARAGVAWADSQDLASFWQHILEPTLRARHGVAPTHTPEEMARLMSRFPNRIRHLQAWHGGQMVAGVVLYVTARAVHAQYIAASPRGRELGALDGLFAHLLAHYAPTHRWFSFGISTYDAGRRLNQGLHDWKMGFGGHECPHLVYELPIG
jgi:hypothetical protein